MENLANTYYQAERYEELLPLAGELVERYPFESVNYNLLANAHRELDDADARVERPGTSGRSHVRVSAIPARRRLRRRMERGGPGDEQERCRRLGGHGPVQLLGDGRPGRAQRGPPDHPAGRGRGDDVSSFSSRSRNPCRASSTGAARPPTPDPGSPSCGRRPRGGVSARSSSLWTCWNAGFHWRRAWSQAILRGADNGRMAFGPRVDAEESEWSGSRA